MTFLMTTLGIPFKARKRVLGTVAESNIGRKWRQVTIQPQFRLSSAETKNPSAPSVCGHKRRYVVVDTWRPEFVGKTWVKARFTAKNRSTTNSFSSRSTEQVE